MGAMTSLWSFATRPFRAGDAPPRPNSPARREAERALLDETTASYRPGSRPLAGFFDGSSDLPDFARMLSDVPAMMATARVSHVMDVYKSGISGAEVELQDASSPEVGEFALSEAKRFWQRCLLDAQNSYDYGRGGAECVYTDEDGPLRISHLLPFAGPDARPLLRGNDYFGIRVQGAANVSDLWGAGALPAKGFWHAHNKKYNRWFGFPQPYPAWRAWRRLCCRNGAEENVDGAVFRFGVAPFVGRFPSKDVPQNTSWGTPGLGDGTQPVSTRDRMRQMMEEIISGAVLCLSSQQTNPGVYDWDVDVLKSVLDVSGLTGYCDSLEKQISLGIGVPPEMIEAAEVGSGYSGRAIPLEAWTMRQQTLAWVMLESWWRQIGRPLIWWNYGPGAWARLGVADLLKTRMKALAAAARGGQGAPGAEEAPGGGQQQQGGGPSQGTFQGKTGKWFRKNDTGRTVPAAAPGQRFATLFATIQRAVGDVWQGASGRWFTRRPDGRTVPAKNPNAGEPQPRQRKTGVGKGVGVLRVGAALDAVEEGRATPDHLAALAEHIGSLTVEQLREARRKLSASFGGGRRKDEMVRALREHVANLRAEQVNEPGGTERPAAKRQRSGRAGGAAATAGAAVEKEAGGPANKGADRGGDAQNQPAGAGSSEGVPRGRAREKVVAQAGEVKRRIGRFEKLFRSRGNERVADLMSKLSDHFEKVGAAAALESLGEEKGAGAGETVGYTESNYWSDSMGDFTAAYLARNGIVPVAQLPPGGGKVVSPFTTAYKDLDPDFKPAETPYEDKLEEAKDLPGLQASEDLSKAVGSDVTHLTQDVMARLDEKYGKGQWIIKTYGDDAFAGQGIFFPQRAAQAAADARAAVWESGGELAKYGFSHLRGPAGTIVGIKHTNGDEYRFGTPKYEATIQGDARRAADQAARAAPHEKGMELPNGGKQFMVQPAFPVVGVSEEERAKGQTIVPGEGRVHVVVRDGKAEVIPHSTWLKGEHLPVVFEDEGTKAMARAAQEAIDALPEKARKGQLYAPDLVKTAGGYRVVELNAAVDEGGSGYLWDNPFVIDAYVSHLSGREPGHVRFVRGLLTGRKRG